MVKSRKKYAIVFGIIGLLLVVAILAFWPKKNKTLTTKKPTIGTSTADELLESKELGEDSNVIEEYVKTEDNTETEEESTIPLKKPASEKEDAAGDNTGSENNTAGNTGNEENSGMEDDADDKTQEGTFEIVEDENKGYGKID